MLLLAPDHYYHLTPPSPKKMSDKAVRRTKFEEVWSKIHAELVASIKGQGMPDDAVKWYSDVRDYPFVVRLFH